ncbi:hypothetical protein G9P44_000793 [Scheffersomyces stipitis]|nr:hypothetical protein G9P44_000793 [Scheffersomyces stipitis]
MSEIDRVLLTYLRSVKAISHGSLIEKFSYILTNLSNSEDLSNQQLDLSNQQLEPLLDKHIASINTNITQHGFKIDRRKDEISGVLYFVFINSISDDVINSSSNYTVPELDTIKRIIAELVEAYGFQFSIGRVNAKQRVASSLNKSLAEADFFVDRLIDDGWFVSTKDERLLLSIRALSELKTYLVDTFGTTADADGGIMHLCQHCKELVTLGKTKLEGDIRLSFHYKCYDVYSRARNVKFDPSQTEMERIGVDVGTL